MSHMYVHISLDSHKKDFLLDTDELTECYHRW